MSQNVPSRVATRPLSTDVTTALRDRVLTMASSFSPELLGEIDPDTGGLVVTGERAYATVTELSKQHPGLPILIEPTTVATSVATIDRPFILEEDGLFAQTVEEILDHQRRAGASFVLTPSGQIPAGDNATLKALISAANALSAPDVLTLVGISDMWLTAPWDKTLCAALKTSEHPVAVGLANSYADPLERKGATDGYRRVAEELGEKVIGWRADLSGLGLASLGGLGAAVGSRPSQRRFAVVGRPPRSSDKRDRTPHVLLPELMRFSRSSVMHNEWFGSRNPDICLGTCCRGQDIDRFDASNESHESALLHNATALRGLVDACMAVPRERRPSWWRGRIAHADAEHAALGARISRPIDRPTYLARWSATLG